ncbi:MAG: hypothetical protein IJP98_03935 [Clostridia bacterium]|nr:hypothetical protein [Clostridia bacterium]
MKLSYHCPSCLMSLSERMPTCPNCGKPNPYYNADGAAQPDQSASQGGSAAAGADGVHHETATAGKCEYCDSVLYSDEKVCSRCGAANPNFVVHGLAGSSAAGGSRSHGTTNASTGKCPFCGATVRSNEKLCPSCGSENPHYIEDTARVILQPKTIEELKEYCAERDMPLLRMRFFIGENTQEPRAFGIYKDGNGNTVVYKNKADRSRAVRYNGPDEAYGVKEILAKLKEECRARGIDPDHSLHGDGGTDALADDCERMTYANPYTTAGKYTPKNESYKAAIAEQKEQENKKKKTFRLILLIGILSFFVFAIIFRNACTACLNGCGGFLFGGSSGSGYSSGSGSSSYDSGGGWSWFDSDSDSDWDSGSDSWDSWDSGGTDWDSDW